MPGRSEVVVVSEIHNERIVTPTGIGRTVFGDVFCRNRTFVFAQRHFATFFSFPKAADFLQRLQGIVINQSVPVGRHVEDEGAVCFVERYQVLVDNPFGRFHVRCGEVAFPEPRRVQRQARQGRRPVGVFGDVLSGILFEGLDVGVEQCVLWVFGRVQVHDEAVRLELFNEVIDVVERDFFV